MVTHGQVDDQRRSLQLVILQVFYACRVGRAIVRRGRSRRSHPPVALRGKECRVGQPVPAEPTAGHTQQMAVPDDGGNGPDGGRTDAR